MRVGRADKFISGQVRVLLKKLFPCRVRTEFKSLAFQVFGDEAELRENAETRFVDMGRDEDAVQRVDLLAAHGIDFVDVSQLNEMLHSAQPPTSADCSMYATVSPSSRPGGGALRQLETASKISR